MFYFVYIVDLLGRANFDNRTKQLHNICINYFFI